MGLYDREYVREEPTGFSLGGNRMMVTNIVLINVAVWVLDKLSGTNGISDFFSLKANLFVEPWNAWQLITSGFVHSPDDIMHIVGNMAGLWFLGREVELKYGSKRFLQFYLSTIVLAALGWVLTTVISYGTLNPEIKIFNLITEKYDTVYPQVLGASGGVFGVVALYIFNFPHRVLLIWGILPVKAWLFGVLYLVFTAYQSSQGTDNIAHSAHVVGAACGYLYFRTGWDLGSLIPAKFSLSALRPKPKFRIHDPDNEGLSRADEKRAKADAKLSSEVDRILQKISQEGEASLSSKERKTLEDASRKYQRRRD